LKKKKISKNWLAKHKKDRFFIQSKMQGFRSRASFKLIEMNKKFKFLQQNSLLLDLGSSPGSWSQVASKEISRGKILSVDIKEMENINNVDFIKGDFLEQRTSEKIKNYFNNRKINVVISDMAINTSGNKNLDSYNTGELCLSAMNLAIQILQKDGVFISKLFMGSIFAEIHENANKYFKKVIKYKPLSSKKESKEIYIYCKGILKV
jgi:23S rRNA (uridine2552-2'-O)-methyltransferase